MLANGVKGVQSHRETFQYMKEGWYMTAKDEVLLLSQAGQFIQDRCLVRLVAFPGQIHTYLVNLTSRWCAAKLKGYWLI